MIEQLERRAMLLVWREALIPNKKQRMDKEAIEHADCSHFG